MRALTKVILTTVSIFICLPNSILAQAPDTLWTTTIGSEFTSEFVWSICEAHDGGFVATGYSSSEMDDNLILFKVDTLGNLLWFNEFGNIQSQEKGDCVESTSDEGFIITGT